MPGDQVVTDDLIAASFAVPSRGPSCWAAQLEGPAADYIRRLDELNAQGRRPVYSVVARILREHFGVERDAQIVGRHFRGDCTCPR